MCQQWKQQHLLLICALEVQQSCVLDFSAVSVSCEFQTTSVWSGRDNRTVSSADQTFSDLRHWSGFSLWAAHRFLSVCLLEDHVTRWWIIPQHVAFQGGVPHVSRWIIKHTHTKLVHSKTKMFTFTLLFTFYLIDFLLKNLALNALKCLNS